VKLNFFERAFIVNPLRTLLQHRLETRQLFKMGGPMTGGRALEIGCGAGGGIGLIERLFGANRVDAFDMDWRMVRQARRRRSRRSQNLRAWVGNVRQTPVRDASYDAVFNFGVLHHVVDWRAGLRDVYRVLRPGGRFYCEEILAYYITHPVIGRLMRHPQEDRFDTAAFCHALDEIGFKVRGVRAMANLYLWVIADKPAASLSGDD
jgi:ubiquinone/menaquinone biosynthesis C-methylase UbiE